MSQDKVYTLLERLELDLNFAKDTILSELYSCGVFDLNKNWKILDRAIGGGQLVKWCEDSFLENNISPNGRVYGCEKRKASVKYSIDTHSLKGTYNHTGDYLNKPKFDNISFLPGDRNFKYIEVGNYPYNDGSVNNNVIWNKFISDVRRSDADAVAVVVQASFISQQFKGMSKTVKQDLIALGCYKIIINEYSDFDETKAKVKTCIVFCRKGYQGAVTYVERITGLTVQRSLELPFDMIFDLGKRKLLSEVETARINSFNRFPQYIKLTDNEKQKWCIGSYYKTEGFDKNPLKQFVLIPPNSSKEKNYYVIFGSANTETDANIIKEQLESFWFNDCVQAVLILTRYQISLDKTQYAKIPKTIINKVFGEDDLFDIWNISNDAREAARDIVKDCNYKKKIDAEDN
jgi:hypothetical protein